MMGFITFGFEILFAAVDCDLLTKIIEYLAKIFNGHIYRFKFAGPNP